jgi:glutathione synthase/RimK-type ligase-like ATP-grasp enzyme
MSNERDLTTDYLVLELQRRGTAFFRLNTERLPQALVQMAAWPAEDWSIRFAERTLEGAQVKAAYFRRPGHPIIDSRLSAGDREYCETEWLALLKSLYSRLEGRWLNSPQAIVAAEDKPRQLLAAHRLGFDIPSTVVTNDPANLDAFDQPIAKPLRQALLHGDTETVMFTTRLSAARAAAHGAGLTFAPVILQQEILKAADIRVTVVGDQVFATEISSQVDPDAEVDWRRGANADLPHSAINLPVDLARRCVTLTSDLGLRFGAIDLIRDRADRFWFLEINPNGQWAWIENRVGHHITAAIADQFERLAAA